MCAAACSAGLSTGETPDAVTVQFNDQAEASIAVGQQYLSALKAHHAPAFRITDAYLALGRNFGIRGRLDESEAVLRATPRRTTCAA